MRPIRLILVLLAVAAALVMVLLRPLPGRAAVGHTGQHPAKKTRPKRSRHLTKRASGASTVFGSRVVQYAKRFLGVRYTYGGFSPRTGFDCSGLVRYVYGHFGISLPHSSFGDLWRGRRVSRGHLRPGDLVFFDDASHVGIYVGSGRFIDAPHSGAVVRITSMTWFGSYYAARRLRGPA